MRIIAGRFCHFLKKEVMLMEYITVSELFTYSLVLIAFASLIVDIVNNKNKRK